MKKTTILILVNDEIVVYNFRKELVIRLLEEGYNVIISSPSGSKINELVKLGAQHDEVILDNRGTNPIRDIKLLQYYKRIIKIYKPDIIFGYTIKPNIYGSIASKKYSVPYVANITGLGTAVENGGGLQKLIVYLYKYAFSDVQTAFFQNETNRQFFIDNNIAIGKHKLLPGSGVNLEHFSLLPYPSVDEKIKFAFISRIMKDKGIDHYLEAAKYLKTKYSNIEFHAYGHMYDEYKKKIMNYDEMKIVQYHGAVEDVRLVLQNTHCVILPSYHEGMSNVLLESAASGRPVLASNIPGCQETFDDGVSGLGFESKSTDSLILAIEKFINMSYENKKIMGLAGRRKMENEFDRQIVVSKYLDELNLAQEEVVNG